MESQEKNEQFRLQAEQIIKDKNFELQKEMDDLQVMAQKTNEVNKDKEVDRTLEEVKELVTEVMLKVNKLQENTKNKELNQEIQTDVQKI